MPWYQALAIIGSAIALSIMSFTRPTSGSRPMAYTLLIGGIVLVSIGLAIKDVIEAFFVAAWLASS
jgi:hypothetical protein